MDCDGRAFDQFRQSDALDGAYQDNFAKHMIVAADPAQAPENFTGFVFSSDEEKVDALDKMMNDVYRAVRYVLPANRFAKQARINCVVKNSGHRALVGGKIEAD